MGNHHTKKSKNEKILRTSILETELFRKNNKHLICDDSSTNRLVLKKYLIMFGCDVDESKNGDEAIEKVKNNGEYKIIWMDIKMPIMDGHGCTQKLRQEMNYKGKIIGLTGYVDDTSINKSLNVGMNFVIPKPFNSDIIRIYVEEANQ